MNRLLLATAAIAAVAMTTSAGAADLPVRGPVYKAPPPVVVATNWSGCYVGGHAGYGWSNWQDNDVPNAAVPAAGGNPVAPPGFPLVYGYSGDFKTGGFVGGVQLGCDYQYGPVVLGLVSDISWTSQSESSAPFAIVPALPPDSADEVASVKMTTFGTARARLGWAAGNALFYATGGLAWARGEVSYAGQAAQFGVPVGAFAVSNQAYHLGWAAGLGLDYMFAPNWTIGLEYLHLDLGNANYRFGTTFPNVTVTQALSPGTNVSLRSDIVRLTLNYRFGGTSLARY